MTLLFVSATRLEISQTADWLNQYPLSTNIQNHEWLISGIGQLQTAYLLGRKLTLLRPDLVIQAGIGGSSFAADIGKCFAIRSEMIADLGAREKTGFRNIFELGLDEPDRFPFYEGQLVNPYPALLEFTDLPVVDGYTVNEIRAADTEGFQRNPIPVVESMEGAALHYVCLMEGIPFLQIRSVSNLLGERDKSRWKMKEALEALHKTMVMLIQKLEKADETILGI